MTLCYSLAYRRGQSMENQCAVKSRVRLTPKSPVRGTFIPTTNNNPSLLGKGGAGKSMLCEESGEVRLIIQQTNFRFARFIHRNAGSH